MPNTALVNNNGRQTRLVAIQDFTFANVVETTVPVIAIRLPVNSIVLGGALTVSTVWNTTGAATVTIGDGASAARYLGATNLKALARTPLLVPGYLNVGGLNILVIPTLADILATTGAARLEVEYIIDGRATEVQTN